MVYYGIQQNGFYNNVKKTIILTSIFQSTKAVDAYSKLGSYGTIVVGDKKSPIEYGNSNVNFLSVEKQLQLGYTITSKLPYNHYSRKNIGYIFAIYEGAEVIIDSDDDNIPFPDWSFPDFKGKYDQLNSEMGFINIYNLFTEQEIWPR